MKRSKIVSHRMKNFRNGKIFVRAFHSEKGRVALARHGIDLYRGDPLVKLLDDIVDRRLNTFQSVTWTSTPPYGGTSEYS